VRSLILPKGRAETASGLPGTGTGDNPSYSALNFFEVTLDRLLPSCSEVVDEKSALAKEFLDVTLIMARLSTASCMFDFCWFELTGLDIASHGPKAPSQPSSLVRNGLR
jgi:hypothetical protein